MYHNWVAKYKKEDGEEFYRFMMKNYVPFHQPTIQLAQRLSLNFWIKDYRKEFLHVWLVSKDLFDFINQVGVKNLKGIKGFLQANGEKKQTSSDPLTGERYNFVRYDIAVHVPNLQNGFAFSYCCMPDNTITLFFQGDEGVGQIHESQYEQAISLDTYQAREVVKNFQFAINLICYMHCFPECVRDGVPEDSKDKKYIPKGKSVRLGIADKIADSINDKIGRKRPHHRTGYFKILSSDFYTNKRGQVIFVKETMVNAKSKTVKMSDDSEKLSKFKE